MIPNAQATQTVTMPPDEANRAAFTKLFCALYPDVLWYACRFVHDTEAAKDMTQEAFVRLWERRATVEQHSARALVYVTVRNLSLNHQRNTSKRAELLTDVPPPAMPASGAKRLDQKQLKQQMQRWIAALPARQREAFELSRFCHLSHREIALVMNVAVHTVEKHITNALQRLRQQLETYDPDLLR